MKDSKKPSEELMSAFAAIRDLKPMSFKTFDDIDIWDKRFLGQAVFYSTFSKDTSTKVGAILVKGRTPIGWGCNGFSKKSSDRPELFENRAEKYKRVLHAEENAIFNSVKSPEGATIYLTHPPCLHCVNVLSQNDVVRVVYIKPNADFASRWCKEETLAELSEHGVRYTEVDISEIIDVVDNYNKTFQTWNTPNVDHKENDL